MTSRALAPIPPPLPSLRLLAAQGRVRRLLDEAAALDREVRELSAEAGAFETRWAREAGAALAERDAALGLARRVRRLEQQLQQLAGHSRTVKAAAPRASAARTVRPVARLPAPAPIEVEVLEPEAQAVKRLHRLLARALHPDLGLDEPDRARRSTWMARVNAAYHAQDLAALELLLRELGLGPPPEPPGEAGRLARLARREAALSAALAALRGERERLLRGEPLRLRAEAARRAAEGGDLAAELRASAAVLGSSALEDAMARLAAVMARAPAVPAAGGELGVRAPLEPGEASRGRPAALLLAEATEGERALALLALLAEEGGAVPEGLASPAALSRRWDALRERAPGLAGAPALPRALSRLPTMLELGLREEGGALAAGLQLASPLEAPAVRALLATPLAREVLAVLGPDARCARCEQEVFALHLHRVRGLDLVHGLACPRCGEVLRSYVRWGAPRGVEGLHALSRAAGLVVEIRATLGGREVAFELPAALRPRLTAGALRRTVHGVLFLAHRVPLGAADVELIAGGRRLGPRARVPEEALDIAIRDGAGMSAEEAAERVAAAASRRFRV